MQNKTVSNNFCHLINTFKALKASIANNGAYAVLSSWNIENRKKKVVKGLFRYLEV